MIQRHRTTGERQALQATLALRESHKDNPALVALHDAVANAIRKGAPLIVEQRAAGGS